MKTRREPEAGSLLQSGKNPVALSASLALPAIAEQLLLTLVSYVDTAMVGSLGAGATAAISVTASTNWLVNGVLTALGVGYSVRVAFYIGAQERERVQAVIVQAALGSALFGLLMMAVGLPVSWFLPGWMGAAQEIIPNARLYLLILMLVVPARTFSTVFSAILRCMGNTKTPMIFNTLANIINVILNTFLIYPSAHYNVFGARIFLPGAGLGVPGAAIATAISLVLCAGAMTASVLLRRGPYRPGWRGVRFDGTLQKQAIAISLPVALERITISSGQILMTRMVSTLGTVALAANYVAVTAEQMCYMPAYGIASASTALVGQAIGGARWEKAKKYGRITGEMAGGLSGIMAVLMFLFAHPLAGIFSSDPEVGRLAAQMLRIVAVAEPMFGVATAMSGALRGAGEARYPFFIGLLCMIGIRVPLAFGLIFGARMGLAAAWIAMAVDLNLRGVLCWRRFSKCGWMQQSETVEESV